MRVFLNKKGGPHETDKDIILSTAVGFESHQRAGVASHMGVTVSGCDTSDRRSDDLVRIDQR